MRISSLVSVFALALTWALGSSAMPQPRMPAGFEEAFIADFLRRDLVHFEHDLHLDANQKTIVQALFVDYEAAFKLGVDGVREKISALQPLSGQEDPTADAKRQELKERLSEVIERAQLAKKSGTDETQMRQFQEEISAIQRELAALLPEALNPQNIQKILDEAGAHIEAWNAQKKLLREKFVADVQTVLTAEQLALWPALDRKLVREKTIGRGRLQGESVDLVALVNELHLDAAAAQPVAPVLAEYETQLDAALRARNERITGSQRDQLKALAEGNEQLAAAEAQRQAALHVAVRNVNDDFAPRIAQQLPSDKAVQFEQNYRHRAYPRVFRTTHAQRVFNAAQELPGLGADVLNSINELERGYLTELGPLNDQTVAAIRQHEPEQFSRDARNRTGLLKEDPRGDENGRPAPSDAEQPDAPDAMREIFARRNELGRRYLKQLESLLTPEQFQTLPHGGQIEDVEEDQSGREQ